MEDAGIVLTRKVLGSRRKNLHANQNDQSQAHRTATNSRAKDRIRQKWPFEALHAV